MSPVRRLRIALLLLLVCLVLDTLVLRRFLVRTELEPGLLGRGYFEEVDARVSVVVQHHISDGVLLEIGRDRAGDLSVPPGNTAVLPLDLGRQYVISAQTDLAPYCVFGATDCYCAT